MTSPSSSVSKNTFTTLEDRAGRLERAALAFCRMLDSKEAANRLLDFFMELPDAYAGIVVRVDHDRLHLLGLKGYPEAIEEKLKAMTFATKLPVVDAVRERRAIFLETADAFHSCYPDCGSVRSASLTHAIAALPLLIEDRCIGAVAVSFNQAREFCTDSRAHLQTIVAMAAQALERAQLFSEMKILSDRHTTALRNGKIGVWEMDTQTKIISRFGHFDTLFGIENRSEPWTYEDFLAAVHPADREHRVEAMKEIIQRGDGGIDSLFRVIWPDRSVHWLAASSRIFRDPDGKPSLVRGAVSDVTSLKETEAELQRSIQLRDEFVAMASHELKTPLTALKLHLELLRLELETRSAPPSSFQRVDTVSFQADRLNNLINQLLDSSRIQNGKLNYRFSDFDLSDCVRVIGKHYQEELTLEKIPFTFEVPPSVPFRGDRLRIEQLVENLVSNAVRHGSGSPIALQLLKSGSQIKISVADQGPGIPHDAQLRIFDPFEQGPQGANQGGLGLGLFIVREITMAHGGEIALQSQPGGGAVFTISFYDR